MYTKLAVSRNFARRPQAAAAVALPFANDNRLDRRAHARPAGRQCLACHWHVNPATRRLECSWQLEATDTDDPVSDSRIIAAVVLASQRVRQPRAA
jgi:hypothetical protein